MKKANSLLEAIGNSDQEDAPLKRVIKKKVPKKEQQTTMEDPSSQTPIEEKKPTEEITPPKKQKRTSKSYFLTEDNITKLDRYCSIQHLKTGEKVNSSAIVDKLIADFLKDKNTEI